MKNYLKALSAGFLLLFLSNYCTVHKETAKEENKLNSTGVEGVYSITEKYFVKAGALTGQKGETNYNITVEMPAKDTIFLHNFAGSYNINAAVTGSNFVIYQQKVPYQDNSAFISGSGYFRGDSIFYKYLSGGPAGQIECDCKGVKRNEKNNSKRPD